MLDPMDFQRLPTVPSSKQLLETGLGQARRGREGKSGKPAARATIRAVDRYVTRTLLSIRRAYPDLSALPEPLPSLIELDLSLDDARQALGSLQWAASGIGKLAKKYSALIGMDEESDAKRHEGAFLGRVKSILSRIEDALETVSQLRRILVELPVLRDDALLVAIAGFPNVGKSTLLSRLTSASPEIASYAFTTKGLNLGVAEHQGLRFQFVDTPGVLDREKENVIERRAHLIIEHADLIVYVFDPTQTYPLEDQLKLYGRYEAIRYVSKTDLAPVPERIPRPYLTDPDALLDELVARSRG